MTQSVPYHKAISGMISTSTTQYHAIFMIKAIPLVQLRKEDGFRNLRDVQWE